MKILMRRLRPPRQKAMNIIKSFLHALGRGPTTSPGTGTSQTDRTKTSNSGDSRERPALDFDWNDVEPPPQLAVEQFLMATTEEQRQFPLAIALQVHDQIESSFTDPRESLNALAMAEHRGGLRALKTFARLYLAATRSAK